MKHLITYNEMNEIDGNRFFPSQFEDEIEEIDGNVASDYYPEDETEIDGNAFSPPEPPKSNGEKETGIVRKFIPSRGFGFITGDDGGDYFTNTFHSIDKIKTGDRVEFIIMRNKRTGKSDKATKVKLI